MPTRPPVHRPAHQPNAAAVRLTYERERGSPSARGYDRDWQRFRLLALSQRPLCHDCLPRVTAATEVHHIAKLRDRPDLRLVMDNVLCLCRSCHSVRTSNGE